MGGGGAAGCSAGVAVAPAGFSAGVAGLVAAATAGGGGTACPSAGGTLLAPVSAPGASLLTCAAGSGAGLPASWAFGFQPLLRAASSMSCEGLRDTPRSTKGTGTRVTYTGPYAEVANDCDAAIAPILPWTPSDGEALVSFEFNADLSELLDWFADDTEDTRYNRADWYMYDMFAPFDPADPFVHYEEVYTDPDFSVYYSVDVTLYP